VQLTFQWVHDNDMLSLWDALCCVMCLWPEWQNDVENWTLDKEGCQVDKRSRIAKNVSPQLQQEGMMSFLVTVDWSVTGSVTNCQCQWHGNCGRGVSIINYSWHPKSLTLAQRFWLPNKMKKVKTRSWQFLGSSWLRIHVLHWRDAGHWDHVDTLQWTKRVTLFDR